MRQNLEEPNDCRPKSNEIVINERDVNLFDKFSVTLLANCSLSVSIVGAQSLLSTGEASFDTRTFVVICLLLVFNE